jgi:hypothetical protein
MHKPVFKIKYLIYILNSLVITLCLKYKFYYFFFNMGEGLVAADMMQGVPVTIMLHIQTQKSFEQPYINIP